MEPTPIAAHRRLVVVVMGVAGSGKSTIAAGIAELLSLPFIEGDVGSMAQHVIHSALSDVLVVRRRRLRRKPELATEASDHRHAPSRLSRG